MTIFDRTNEMTAGKTRLPTILALNIISVALFCSWLLPANHGFWFPIDSAIYHFFNHQWVTHRGFLWLVAITNNRAFDAISLLCMGTLMLSYWLPASKAGRRKIILMGVTMLISAVLLNQIGQAIPIERPSPSISFTDTYRMRDLISIDTKDSSGDSFPGDHGTMLLIFCGFMLRYFGGRAFTISIAIFLFFILPRIMGGAHWFTDVFVGSLSVVLMVLPWILMTSLSDRVIAWLDRIIPGQKAIK
ncbi:lipid A 1-diphosphate synthase [Salmonella enterica subsp. enterica serovar Choleraesuis]|nr:lipid A 1-diphosphate synthase [Salmonella enterica subsp. enterica serovar Choleraesuis]